jgi:hypothetical protein
MKKSETIEKKYQIPKISVTMSIEELIAFSEMLRLGKLFTRPEAKHRVSDVLKRIGKILVRRGLKQEIVDKLVIL